MRILWIPHTAWHVPQRAHQFCRPLAERHEVHVAETVTDFRSPRDYLSPRYLRTLAYGTYRDGPITVHRIPRFSPALHLSALRSLNSGIFARLVKRIIERNKIDCVVGTFLVPPPSAPRLVFDSFDANAAYWRTVPRAYGYAEEIALTEFRYLDEADAVVAASSVLADKARALGARGEVHFIPNGVDLQRFDSANGARLRSRLGVSGTLVGSIANYDRARELDRVVDAAKLSFDKDFVFFIAGRGVALAHARKRVHVERVTNVTFHGFVSPEETPDMTASFDVGLCSYLKTPMDDARTPMRMLLYAAAGLPTVCTDLEEVRRMNFDNVVRVSDDAPALVSGVELALQLPRKRPPQVEQYDLPTLVRRYEDVLRG